MKARKEKTAVAARDAKRRLDNPLIEAEKAENSAARPKGNERFSGRRLKRVRCLI
jgi:hypothetical protein